VGLGNPHETTFLAWLTQNAWAILAGIGCYVVVGIAWATFRWWLLVRVMRDNYERRKAEWLAPGNLRSTATMLRSLSDLEETMDRVQNKPSEQFPALTRLQNQLPETLSEITFATTARLRWPDPQTATDSTCRISD